MEYRDRRDRLIEFFRGADSLPDTPCSRIPLITTVRRSVWTRYTKFALHGREITPDTPDGAIHKLRIMGKKLRYLLDFFSPLFPMESAAPLAMGLKMIQKSLGVFNDYSVQEEFLRTIAPHHGDADPDMVPAVEALASILGERKHAQRGRVIEVLGPFYAEDTAERFRDMAGPALEAAQGAAIAK
jgi:CHAD domain-containing protein